MSDHESAASAPDGGVRLDDVDGVAVLRVVGALDLTLAPRMRELLERAEQQRPAAVIIDLSGVDFLASIAMSELLHAQRSGSVPLRLVAAHRIVLRPLTLTRLIDEFDVYPTLPEAVAGR